jgi:hypothetical protein
MAFDIDPVAVGRNYRAARQGGDGCLGEGFKNFRDPTPDVPLRRGFLILLKKPVMGGRFSEIIIASNLASIGFFYPFFTPFLMRSA